MQVLCFRGELWGSRQRQPLLPEKNSHLMTVRWMAHTNTQLQLAYLHTVSASAGENRNQEGSAGGHSVCLSIPSSAMS